jgi:hypothetical protein
MRLATYMMFGLLVLLSIGLFAHMAPTAVPAAPAPGIDIRALHSSVDVKALPNVDIPDVGE